MIKTVEWCFLNDVLLYVWVLNFGIRRVPDEMYYIEGKRTGLVDL